LSRNHPILWVDSQPLRMPSFSRSDLGKIIHRVKSASSGIRELQENIWGITPKTIPIYRSAFIQNWNDQRLRKTIQGAGKSLKMNSPILWAFLPTAVKLVGTLKERLIVYHCVDEYSANPGVNSRVITDLEQEMLRKADVVFATSQPLQRSLQKFHSNVTWIPAGVDEVFFQKQNYPEPKDLAGIHHPRIGFTGAISGYKVDIPLLIEASERYPEVSFVLIGPVGAGDPYTDVSYLKKQANVFFLGPRKYEQLPEYLYHMDALMLPSAQTPSIRASFPVKIYEYLATGKPVIARKQETLMSFWSVIYLATSNTDFLDGIGQVLKDRDSNCAKARVKLAMQNTWNDRIRQISTVIEQALICKGKNQR
jgi:glycosyltransferase involved in cell wall biosynthesis